MPQKLSPFFPPIEPLQSLNLRAALFRCLEQAKKTGLLGRDAVLRKTMLDECKGERLEEVLAVFSMAVLKKVETSREQDGTIVQRLAMENFSYSSDRTALSTLILAHRASLSRTITAKSIARSNYDDFASLLKLKDRQIARRHEQLKVSIEENRAKGEISDEECHGLQDRVRGSWTGSNEWLEAILYGDSRYLSDGLLASPFDDVWEHVEDASVGDMEDQQRKGLLEQLDARIREQKHRLEKWQGFEKTLKGDNSKPQEQSTELGNKAKGIDLGFGAHEALQLPSPRKATKEASRAPLEEYTRLMEKLHADLANVGKSRRRETATERSEVAVKRQYIGSPVLKPSRPLVLTRQNSTLNSDFEQYSPKLEHYATEFTSQILPSEHATDRPDSSVPSSIEPIMDDDDLIGPTPTAPASRSISTYSTLPPPSPPSPSTSSQASNILSAVQTTSPSPTKPRHVLSLAERTRLSMSRVSTKTTSLSHLEDFDDIQEIPLSQNAKATSQISHLPSAASSSTHEDLIARTRQSLSNSAAVQKSAQIERRLSLKAAARAKRASYLPAKQLETTFEGPDLNTEGSDRKKLIEEAQEADYEAVFKSRPKIKTSPETSPVKAWGEIGGALGRRLEDGSSSPAPASASGVY
jgi:HAUS augmin-like complex subunit 6 N-terminus